MPSVLADIRQWAKTLPYWEQVALDKILAAAPLTDLDYDELLKYLLEDEGLAEPISQRPQLQFDNSVNTASTSSVQLRLVKISNLQNVNALVPGQSITFGPTLTAIFGANGSGKSGYARVLGCAGFTRGDKEVLPDITQPLIDNTILSADIEVSDGTSSKIINYQIGNQCPELATFYVFDSTSVQVHLTGSNTFSFSPAGLFYLTKLADVTDKVRECLNVRIENYMQPHNFGLMFQGNSAVTELIANLSPETSLEKLRQIATLTQEEKKRIGDLDNIEIPKLKTLDIPSHVTKLTNTIRYLEYLTKCLSEVESKSSDDAISNIGKSVEIYLERLSVAQRVSIDQFKSEHFTQTGSDVWHSFIVAAKALAEAERISSELYPEADDHCLLCQQPLTTEARNLLLRLWAFLEGEAQAKLSEAQTILEEKRSALIAIDLNFFDNQSASYLYLQEYNPELLRQIASFIEACNLRREFAIRIIDIHEKSAMPQMPNSGRSNIEEIIKTLKTERDELNKRDPAQQIADMEQQLLNLRHRLLLSQHLSKIEECIQKQIWAKKASKIGGNTKHITQKHKKLFEQLVTDRYIELFEQILRDLQRPLKVKIETKGRKGATYKQIVLEADPTAPLQVVTPDKVLSEGEKRATALADFLTEVALDTTSSGIILDDPVTSLDLEWRETIASILIRDAKLRQVIVFTHDLPFLYFLKKYAERQAVNVVTHWIKRGDNDGKPGYVFLNNSPALERDYRKATKAYEIYQLAKNASAAEQESLLHQGFAALRTSYEALIIFDLFNEVVMRFDERVSFGRLKDIVWDMSIAEEVVSKCELLSKYIEGHLHSDAFVAAKPTCEMLVKEIEDFKTLKKRLSDLKNS